MSRFGWAEPLVDRTPEAARPQPWDCSLLWGENKHRAGLVWRDPQACKALKLRQRSSALTFHPQYETVLRECGLYTVVSLLGQSPCKELVTALLERWRPETNTFHLLQGEATITLEDVEVLTGLPTRGRPASVGYDARSFSWGSAVLAWLYKAMGRAAFFTGTSQKGTGDIGGFTLLVQLWALERFPYIADRYIAGGDPPIADSYPRGVRWMPIVHRHQHRVSMKLEDIRYALDRFTWLPYASRELAYQLEPDDLWRAVTTMLCVDSIAWHHPDRCMKQFGYGQRVPQDAELQGRVEQLLG
ncbi:Serine/threonine-protein phosphatase 7 long form homolog [Linum perenne]